MLRRLHPPALARAGHKQLEEGRGGEGTHSGSRPASATGSPPAGRRPLQRRPPPAAPSFKAIADLQARICLPCPNLRHPQFSILPSLFFLSFVTFCRYLLFLSVTFRRFSFLSNPRLIVASLFSFLSFRFILLHFFLFRSTALFFISGIFPAFLFTFFHFAFLSSPMVILYHSVPSISSSFSDLASPFARKQQTGICRWFR